MVALQYPTNKRLDRGLMVSRLDALQRAIDELRAAILGGDDCRAVSAPAPRWISMKAAATGHGCTIETMTRHVRNYGLGAKVGGRWNVDSHRVQAWRNHQPYEPLRSNRS